MENKVWKCSAGSFSGYEEDGCIQIKGIRYATSERYAAPVPYVYNPGVHSCIKPAPFAIQQRSTVESFLGGTKYEDFTQEENCQYLSITMPGDVTPESKLPVMVWIHGGAYRNGGCESPTYNRIPLVKENHVVVAGINFRLGVLGFVKDRNGQFANNGLLDVIEGLKWIKTNIEAFGGDPENITIFGQSSGADCVRCIMLAEGTENLYRRAIMQSDPIGTMENREEMERKILAELNRLPLDADIQTLRDAQISITEHVTEKGLPKYLIFGPHFGVYPLPALSEIPNRIKEIAPNHDLLIGSNSREVTAYIGDRNYIVLLDHFVLTRWFIEYLIRRLGYPIFNDPDDAFAQEYADAGGKTYRYLFYWSENQSVVSACHSLDCLPLFGGKHFGGQPIAMGLSEETIYEKGIPMRKIWADFARTGTITDMHVDGMLDIVQL